MGTGAGGHSWEYENGAATLLQVMHGKISERAIRTTLEGNMSRSPYTPFPAIPIPKKKKRVFLSFRAEDRQQVQGLRLLAANPDYDLEFYDESVRVAIDSRDADYVKRVIREKIARTSVTVCLISALTHTSAWVDWELSESAKKGNKIVAMGLKGVTAAVLPVYFRTYNNWFWFWDPMKLKELIEND
jgi:MTH538 TIR-like domain (DUF1863)